MMKNFWQELPKPFFILAPMDEVTDVVFRHVVATAGAPDVYFTEFTNTDSYCSPQGQHSTRRRLQFTDDERPLVAHIWGKNPDHFRQMAIDMKKLGFKGVDINTGCPAKHVVQNGAGSGLIRTPDIAIEIIKATKEAGLPVSVKARLGDVRPEEFKDWLKTILEQDIANLSIHLRTRKEMSKVPAHYELIPEIKKLRDEIAPQTLLTINGDIRNRAHGIELVEKYGVDGIVIGRGVFSDPFAFSTDPPTGERKEQLMALLNLHLDLFDQYSTDETPRKFEPLKRFFKIYVRDFPGASELREQLMHAKTTDEVRALIREQ